MTEDMDSPFFNRVRMASTFGALVLIVMCSDVRINAQDNLLVELHSGPPPMKFLPASERSQLSGVQDSKARLKTSIGLAEIRLLRAEQFTVDQLFISATTELGVYQAIIEDALRFLSTQKIDSNKTRDLYKRLEIQLRLYAIRIEAIRRVTPLAYAMHVTSVWDFCDSARAKALNAFFCDTVVPLRSTDIEKTSGVENSPRNPTVPVNRP